MRGIYSTSYYKSRSHSIHDIIVLPYAAVASVFSPSLAPEKRRIHPRIQAHESILATASTDPAVVFKLDELTQKGS